VLVQSDCFCIKLAFILEEMCAEELLSAQQGGLVFPKQSRFDFVVDGSKIQIFGIVEGPD
jgi:hypothetical protein